MTRAAGAAAVADASRLRDVAGFRVWRQSLPLLPFECLDTAPRQSAERYQRLAERILSSGWRCGSHLVEDLSAPIAWQGGPRSVSFHLHSWDPHAILLMAYSLTGQWRFLAPCLSVALDWLDRGNDSRGAAEILAARGSDPQAGGGSFAWYDMAVGLRSYRLGYLLDAAARLDDVPDDIVARLLHSFRLHLEVLADEAFLVAHTNHGFYQALGQLAATWRYRDDAMIAGSYRQAMQRVRAMLDRQYFREGTHREHSPGYHLATLATIKNATSSGIVEDPDTSTLIAAAERALAWFVLPNGNIAAVGDTDPWTLDPADEPAQRFSDPLMRWALSQGRLGEPIPYGLKVFGEGGWLAVRAKPRATASCAEESYLLQWAGFHSRTHKHADHLSFLWFDAGEEVVVDAGRYFYSHRTEPDSPEYRQGYWYGDPHRMYVESTRAHNCVEIDGQDYQRRAVKPFGSALRRWGGADGVFWSECDVSHADAIRHARLLAFRPGHFLLVCDWLSGGSAQSHRFDQWFHLAPAFEVEAAIDRFCAVDPHRGTRLSIIPALPGTRLLAPEKGVNEPRIQGWFSDRAGSLVPNWAVALRAEGPSAAFATLLVLGDEVAIDSAATQANPSGRKGRIGWRDERGVHRLSFERPRLGMGWVNFETQAG
ncbi:MAG: heparinase II/III family protein [Alphaproteobacteria bacterium]|nr:heparinase II/III family protein [Alphaproteobacteria bacterium]